MTPGQQLLAKLLIQNKLLSEGQCIKLFAQVPDPEQALPRLIKAGHVNERVGMQLLEFYRQKMAALGAAEAEAPPDSDTTDLGEMRLADEPEPVRPKPPEPTPTPKADPTPAATKKEPTLPATPKKHASAASEFPPGAGGRQLLHSILKMGRDLKASDVHITSNLKPVVRVNGHMREMDLPVMSPETCAECLLSLLDGERRAHFEEHRDLDFCYEAGGDLGRFRTNYLMEHNGINGVFRLIQSRVPSLEELGMPDLVRKLTTYAVGIVLLTGPKSCGKTTTLAAMVDVVNRTRKEHIITIEDPIEFVHPCKTGHVSQREVGAHTKTFANALRAALREAPHVIVVGEMRDLETTSLAVTAAETGHLVLATLHTPDAIRTIGRVLDVFPPKEQGQIRAMLSESLRGVVSQQLVPGKDGNSMHLALEILVNTPAIGNMIREDRTFQLRGIMQTGRRLGMQLMDDSLIKLVREDKIDLEDALFRASDQDYIVKELKLQVANANAAAAKAAKAAK